MAFDYDMNYHPGNGAWSAAVSTSPVSSAALAEGFLYQVLGTVDIWWKLMPASGGVVVTSAAGEHLSAYEWSPPFHCRTSGDVVSMKSANGLAGTGAVRRVGKA